MMHRIFASAITIFALIASADAAEWGDLTVRFVYDGSVPTPQKIVPNKDPAFCGKFDIVDESLVVNRTNKGIQNVIVYLRATRKKPPVHPSYVETAQASIKLDNSKCRFSPHVIYLRTTQKLLVGNSDSVGHNTNVTTIMNAGQNLLIPAGGETKMQFSIPERVAANTVRCNIHPWMIAHVAIKDHPYGAVSDKDGKLTIKNIPAGKWTFQFWHEKPGYISEGKLNGKSVKWRRGRLEWDIQAGANDLGELTIAAKFMDK